MCVQIQQTRYKEDTAQGILMLIPSIPLCLLCLLILMLIIMMLILIESRSMLIVYCLGDPKLMRTFENLKRCIVKCSAMCL